MNEIVIFRKFILYNFCRRSLKYDGFIYFELNILYFNTVSLLYELLKSDIYAQNNKQKL